MCYEGLLYEGCVCVYVTGASEKVCMSVWLLAPGDRSYQDNIVLLTEIGFLSESLALEYELKAKPERAEGADSDTPFPCFGSASASSVVALDDTSGWLHYEAAPVFPVLSSPESVLVSGHVRGAAVRPKPSMH